MNKIMVEIKGSPIDLMKQALLTTLPHLHKELELIYVKKGNTTVICDNVKHTLCEGGVFIAFPNQIHFYENCQRGEYYVVIFQAELIFAVSHLLYSTNPFIAIISAEQICELSKLILKIFENKGEFTQTANTGLLNLIMSDLLSKLNLEPRHNFTNETLNNILNYCIGNFRDQDIKLDIVAAKLGYSKHHISHIINQKLGVSFSTYINTLRIKDACNLLENTDKKIADISEATGFNSIRSFNRSFIKIMRMTPLEYRKNPNKKQIFLSN